MVTRFLYRPLAPALIEGLRPGGVLLYETFTRRQTELGTGPRNPDYLLNEGELRHLFAPLHLLAYEEGHRGPPASGEWVASLLARKRRPQVAARSEAKRSGAERSHLSKRRPQVAARSEAKRSGAERSHLSKRRPQVAARSEAKRSGAERSHLSKRRPQVAARSEGVSPSGVIPASADRLHRLRVRQTR